MLIRVGSTCWFGSICMGVGSTCWVGLIVCGVGSTGSIGSIDFVFQIVGCRWFDCFN